MFVIYSQPWSLEYEEAAAEGMQIDDAVGGGVTAPESSLEPSGSCNLSRIDNIELVLEMQSALTNESYTVSYRKGVAGAAFQ